MKQLNFIQEAFLRHAVLGVVDASDMWKNSVEIQKMQVGCNEKHRKESLSSKCQRICANSSEHSKSQQNLFILSPSRLFTWSSPRISLPQQAAFFDDFARITCTFKMVKNAFVAKLF
ncbi:hypothetical protein LOAG_01561 [Loa loa]|uniref:Uncharacterized protein n=1 Tax=Loa loa TaxID=7209 RepID=A0A1S0UAQ4_LOALO|nr:hypothetical protein LOAG_01561 [Loa loa]EFO26923.1 hypothetical protein LOAG_01561 [Loa loa]